MNLYHINPETGDVGKCSAKAGNCPFGSLDSHFTTAEAARASYEKTQLSKVNITGSRPDGGAMTYDFSERNLPLAEDSVAKANKRLEKAGVEERFSYTIEHYMDKMQNRLNGLDIMEPRVKMTINTPAVKFDGYTFLAAVEKIEAGFVVKTATGFELNGFTPDNLKCDACGKAINRQKTYLVEDSEGKMIQVGSSCIKNYFGVEPKGLWSLTFDPLARATDSDSWGSPIGFTDAALPTEAVMAYALAISNGGENFVSGSTAYNYGGLSTADRVRDAISGTDSKYRAEVQVEAEKYTKEAKDLVEKLKKTDQSSDYGRNLSVISTGEYTRWKDMNILVSGLSAIAREKREAAKKEHAAKWGVAKSGFMAPIKTPLKGRKLRVYQVQHSSQDDPYSYYGGEVSTTKVVLRDEDNHEVIWWAKRHVDVEPDQEVTLTKGTVKKHGSYRGVDQTTIWRAEFEEEKRDED